MRDLNPTELNDLRFGDTGWVQSEPQSGPYLQYVRALSKKWPHLQFLTDFMEVGTHPQRWDHSWGDSGSYPADPNKRNAERIHRQQRVHVCLLQYDKDRSRSVAEKRCTNSQALKDALDDLPTDGNVELNLLVAEDLSRDVIDLLGTRFDVDPSFFRQQLADYAWSNIGSPWREPPNLDVASSRQSWLQFRYIRTRRFKNKFSFALGKKQSRGFNVFRRLDSDHNESPHWHSNFGRECMIGHIRSRASLWVDPSTKPGSTINAILLLDPTISEGNPMWYKYRNWEKTPSMRTSMEHLDEGPPQSSFFEDFIYWARKPNSLRFTDETEDGDQKSPSSSPLEAPMSALLHLICTEWLTVIDYTQTRLSQIDLELTFHLEADIRGQLFMANTKMHHWRRAIPLYYKMLSETLVKVFGETSHVPGSPRRVPGALETRITRAAALGAYRTELVLVLSAVRDLQSRFDKLSDVATAIANFQESRNSNMTNQRLSNLTWLATTFLPLSLVAGVLSVQDDVAALSDSIGYWARIAIPATIGTMLLLFMVEEVPRRVRKYWEGEAEPRSRGGIDKGAEPSGRHGRISSMFSTVSSDDRNRRRTTDMSLRLHRIQKPFG